VVALDLSSSTTATPPGRATTWTSPPGNHRVACVRTTVASAIACVDTSGTLRVLDRSRGTILGQFSTGVSGPLALARVVNGTPGFVVSSLSQVLRVTGNATLTTLSAVPGYQSNGQKLSPFYLNSAAGWILVASTDLRVHKLSSETGQEIGQSAPITSRTTGMLLGTPSYDTTNNRFIFGTSEGRVWAIPANF
jgi:outer membrane protein assembly factor BamB